MESKRDEVSAEFGQVLKKWRKAEGLTQADLAERSDLHDTYISFLERGLRQPSLEVVLRLAEALETDGAQLVAEVEEVLRRPPRA